MIKIIIRYLPSVIIPTITTLLVTILYGNYLTPDIYGKYNIFVTTVSFLNTTIFAFITTSILRFYNEYTLKNMEYILLSTYFHTILIFLFVLTLLGWLCFKEYAFYILICTMCVVFFTLFTNVLRASDNAMLFNWFKSIAPLLNIFIVLSYLCLYKLGMVSAIIAQYLPMGIISIVFALTYFIKRKIRISFNKSILIESAKYGVPLSIVGFFNVVLSSSDRYIIKYFLGDHEVGIYSFAYRISELSLVNLTMLIIMALFPQLIKVYDNYGRREAEVLLSRYLNIHFIITLPFVFLIFIYAKDIMRIFFPEFVLGSTTVKYVILGTLFFSVSYYTNKAFELTKKTKLMVKILFFCVIVNVLLNICLIPYLGTLGSVLSTIVAYLLYVILSIYVSRNFFRVKFYFQNIFVLLSINFITTLVIFLIPWENFLPYILKILIEVLFYLSFYFVCIIILIKIKIISLKN